MNKKEESQEAIIFLPFPTQRHFNTIQYTDWTRKILCKKIKYKKGFKMYTYNVFFVTKVPFY